MQVTTLEPRRLRRLIRQDRGVGGFGRDVPHAHGYVLVVGGFEQFVLPDDGASPTTTWQRLFGLAVHAAVMRAPIDARPKVDALGTIEWDEVRAVLKAEHRWLPAKADEAADKLAWALFVALWCELGAFAPTRLEVTFPTLAERRAEVDALIAEDIDPHALLAHTRPPDAPALAPAPAPAHTPSSLDDDHEAERAAHRARLTAIIEAATPNATTRVDQVARAKLVEELLDRYVEKGRIDFPALRDAFARNQAKLDDLRARDIVHDPLLAADRQIGKAFPTQHRKAEIYRDALHRLSALLFGTPAGRLLTKLALIPLIGAYALLELIQHTVFFVAEKVADVHVELVNWYSVIAVALPIFLLVNVPVSRRVAIELLRAVGRGLRVVFIDVPRWLAARPFFRTPMVKTLWRFLLEPALVAAVPVLPILVLGALPPAPALAVALAFFALALYILRSPFGDRLEDAVVDASISIRRAVTEDIVPAVVTWVIDVFKGVMAVIDNVMNAIEARLRRRTAKRTWLRVVTAPYYVVAYVFRFILNVSLEPKVNPVKHFPAVTIGHKIVFAVFGPMLHDTSWAAVAIFLLPGTFGFFAWELKENWRLYRANRPRHIEPVPIGSHGETMPRLLRPGFHSGTLPKLFKKLRRNLARRPSRFQRRKHDKLVRDRHHLERDVARFITREVLAYGHGKVVDVDLASNRVRVDLDDHTTLTFEDRGTIVGAVDGNPQPWLCDALEAMWPKAAVEAIARRGRAADPPGSTSRA